MPIAANDAHINPGWYSHKGDMEGDAPGGDYADDDELNFLTANGTAPSGANWVPGPMAGLNATAADAAAARAAFAYSRSWVAFLLMSFGARPCLVRVQKYMG
jgi:hypothetical protein